MIQQPSEEDVARAIASFRKHLRPDSNLPDILPSEMAQAAAVLALFAPVLAEKERLIRELAALLDKQLGTPCEQIRHRQEADDLRAQIANLTERTRLPVIADYIEVQNHSRAMEARALAAEAKRDALREALALYRDAVRVDVQMDGPKFMGSNVSALKRAWEADRALTKETADV